MPDSSDLKFLLERMDAMEARIMTKIEGLHAPGSCPPLAELRQEVKNSSAFWEQIKGAWKVIGIIGGLVGASFGAGMVILTEWWLGKR